MATENSKENKTVVIRQLYFYLVSFAALMMVAISSVAITETILKMTILSSADRWSASFYMPGCDGAPMEGYGNGMMPPTQPSPTQEFCIKEKVRQSRAQEQQIASEHQRELSWSLSMLAVALPLFAIHWKFARSKKD